MPWQMRDVAAAQEAGATAQRPKGAKRLSALSSCSPVADIRSQFVRPPLAARLQLLRPRPFAQSLEFSQQPVTKMQKCTNSAKRCLAPAGSVQLNCCSCIGHSHTPGLTMLGGYAAGVPPSREIIAEPLATNINFLRQNHAPHPTRSMAFLACFFCNGMSL